MGEKERLRGTILEMVKQGHITLQAAAAMVGVSYRQSKRLYSAYRKKGDKGLIQGNYGRPSHNRTDEAIQERAVEAYRRKYHDFGPTFAAEK